MTGVFLLSIVKKILDLLYISCMIMGSIMTSFSKDLDRYWIQYQIPLLNKNTISIALFKNCLTATA